jgi:hypothetical protein
MLKQASYSSQLILQKKKILYRRKGVKKYRIRERKIQSSEMDPRVNISHEIKKNGRNGNIICINVQCSICEHYNT